LKHPGLAITAIELAQGAPPHSEVKQVFQVILKIATGGPPSLNDPSSASPPFRSFLAAGLDVNPSSRPSAAGLGEHPFVAAASPDNLVELVSSQRDGGSGGENSNSFARQPSAAYSSDGSTLGV